MRGTGAKARTRPTPPTSRPAAASRSWATGAGSRALAQREVDLEAARHLVGRFLAPSRFLLERFVAAGWPREKLVHADYGFAPARAVPRRPRATGAPLRVAFVGTLSDYKGVEVF